MPHMIWKKARLLSLDNKLPHLVQYVGRDPCATKRISLKEDIVIWQYLFMRHASYPYMHVLKV